MIRVTVAWSCRTCGVKSHLVGDHESLVGSESDALMAKARDEAHDHARAMPNHIINWPVASGDDKGERRATLPIVTPPVPTIASGTPSVVPLTDDMLDDDGPRPGFADHVPRLFDPDPKPKP